MKEAIVGKPPIGCWRRGDWNLLACPGPLTDGSWPAHWRSGTYVGMEAVAHKGGPCNIN